MSLLDECNFEFATYCVFRDTNLRAAFALTPGVYRRLSRKKSPMLSVVSVLLKILIELALQLYQCMSKQVKILLAETQSQTPL